MMRLFWGHKFISIEEGEKIRRYETLQNRINEKYDIVIHWSCYDTDAQYDDEILSSFVFQQKQIIKKTIQLARQGDATAQNELVAIIRMEFASQKTTQKL